MSVKTLVEDRLTLSRLNNGAPKISALLFSAPINGAAIFDAPLFPIIDVPQPVEAPPLTWRATTRSP